MQRKVIRVGSSAAVVLPKEALKERSVRIGDIVEVEFSKPSASQKKMSEIDPRVIQWTNEFIETYRPALKKLADA